MTAHLVRHKRCLLPVLLAAFLALLAACAPRPAAPGDATPLPTASAEPGAGESLFGSDWLLVSLGSQALLPNSQITLNFEADQLGGFAGCNAYGTSPGDGGGYTVLPDGTLEIPLLASTAMACLEPEGIMDQEAAYLAALPLARSYHLAGDRLELRDAGGQAILTFERRPPLSTDPAPLLNTAWQLVSLNGQPPIEGSSIDLAFPDGHRATGHAGCRDYIAGYQGGEQRLSFYYTAMMGPVCLGVYSQAKVDALLAQEGAFTDALGWTDGYRLEADRLEMVSQRGDSLIFEPLVFEARPPVEGPTWVLLAFVEPNPQAELPDPLPMPTDVLSGTELTLEFREGTALGSAGCNQYNALYRLEGDTLAIETPGTTRMACDVPDGVMNQEQRYLGWLPAMARVHVEGQQLWLEAPDGRALVYRAPNW